jgi:hypothetical protein
MNDEGLEIDFVDLMAKAGKQDKTDFIIPELISENELIVSENYTGVYGYLQNEDQFVD